QPPRTPRAPWRVRCNDGLGTDRLSGATGSLLPVSSTIRTGALVEDYQWHPEKAISATRRRPTASTRLQLRAGVGRSIPSVRPSLRSAERPGSAARAAGPLQPLVRM